MRMEQENVLFTTVPTVSRGAPGLEALNTYMLNKPILGRSHWQPVRRVDRAGPRYRQGDQLGTR